GRGGGGGGGGAQRPRQDRGPFRDGGVAGPRRGARILGRWRLSGVSLVVTLEPCSLCVGAALQARIDRVVYGAPSPKAGALGGLFDLNALPHNHRLAVRPGVLEAECAGRLTRFFQGLRAPEG